MPTLTAKELDDRRHLEWAKQLRVGDTIPDPRYRHLRITRIEDLMTTSVPDVISNLVYLWPIPLSICMKLHNFVEWICDQLGMTEVWDRMVEFENGQVVSAYELVNFPHKEA
jgi:hypothetical protein